MPSKQGSATIKSHGANANKNRRKGGENYTPMGQINPERKAISPESKLWLDLIGIRKASFKNV